MIEISVEIFEGACFGLQFVYTISCVNATAGYNCHYIRKQWPKRESLTPAQKNAQ